MESIFYFFGIIVFITILSKIKYYGDFIDVIEFKEKFKKVTGKDPKKTDYKSEDIYNVSMGLGCLTIFQGLWYLFGLLSSDWIIFILIFLSSISVGLIKKILNLQFKKIIGTFHLVILATVVILLTINHFHLNIDTFEWFKMHLLPIIT